MSKEQALINYIRWGSGCFCDECMERNGMKCYYHYLNNNRKSWRQIVISDIPLIIIDIDFNGDVMGVEYCG